MKTLCLLIVCCVATGFAHNSFTGGYSGAPASPTCASTCHGGSSGTIVMTGFPASYNPGQVYRIVIKHNGGSAIVNFNATTRLGSTASVAGTFATVTNSVLYSGADGGVYANPHLIDSAVFQWTAPAQGAGQVKFYAAAFQGTTSSSNGQSSAVSATATEITVGVTQTPPSPLIYSLAQNYPNPFNPTTTLRFTIVDRQSTIVKVFDLLGGEIATLVNEVKEPGTYTVQFDAKGLSSGVYLYRLQAGQFVETKKLLLLR